MEALAFQDSPFIMATTNSTLFLNGWNRLPDELKLEVLGLARRLGEAGPALQSRYFDRVKLPPFDAILRPTSFDVAVLPFLTCPPISKLAFEALYANNIVGFVSHEGRLPPLRARKHIRRAKMSILGTVVSIKCLTIIAQATSSFANLPTFDLDIRGFVQDGESNIRQLLERHAPISIKGKKLTITYHPKIQRSGIHMLDTLEMVLLPAVSFVAPTGGQVHETWKRWAQIEDNVKRLDEGCTWGEYENGRGGARITERLIWS